MKLTASRPSLIAFSLAFSLAVLAGAGSASASNSMPDTRLMCTRSTWANTDKCKDLAVASKNAPKDLKKEIERLASLTATSAQQLSVELAASTKSFQKEYAKWQASSTKFRDEVNAIQSACHKRLGLKWVPGSSNYWPEQCMKLYRIAPSQPTRRTDTPSRIVWAKAWLDLATIAKTFPQHIQPSQLSKLINVYEPAKACVSNPSCIPSGM